MAFLAQIPGAMIVQLEMGNFMLLGLATVFVSYAVGLTKGTSALPVGDCTPDKPPPPAQPCSDATSSASDAEAAVVAATPNPKNNQHPQTIR